MNKNKDSAEFDEIIHSIQKIYGQDISCFDRGFVIKCLEKITAENNLNSPESYLKLVLENSSEAKKFFDSLYITYSEFFRNPLTFALLGRLVFPMILCEKEKLENNSIRIWSAGCAGGQEAYSIAILLDELLTDKGKNYKYHIFATDINRISMDFAKKGSYDFPAVKNVTLNHISRYFTKNKDNYNINSKLKKHIDFSVYDLLDGLTSCPPESIYGEFDLIICSNLLFYYNIDKQREIINKIRECLPEGGYFVTGEAEKYIVEKMSCFSPVSYAGAIFKKIKQVR